MEDQREVGGMVFQPLDAASVTEMLTWRYEPPYDIYSLDGEDEDEALACFLDPANAYYAMIQDGQLVAYCCFGPDAQVPGACYKDEALDVGLGVRPDCTGQGRGSALVTAVLDFGQGIYAPHCWRVTIAEFNARARRVWQRAGFQDVERFARKGDGLPFVVLTRQA